MTTMRRRDRGSGYLARKPRPDGRWRASYVGSDGRRHYLHGVTKAEAREKLQAALRDKTAGLHVAGPSQTVDEFLHAWLRHKRASLAASTATRYAGQIEQHIVPHLGSVQLRRLTPQHVADLYLALGDSLAPATIRQVHAILRGALGQAVRWHAIAANPAIAVTQPRRPRHEMRFLDTSQVRTLLAAVQQASVPGPDRNLAPLVTTALFTGMRLGELLGLRWHDVDLDGRTLIVRHTLTRVDGAWVLRQPKTPHSRRTLHLAPAAVEALRAHYLATAERLLALGHRLDADTLVFSDRWGNALHPGHVTQRAYKPLLRRAGLPEIRFHDLRHTFATMMLSEGAPVHLVSKMLGHSSPAMTLSVYAHVLPGDEEAMVARLQARLGGGA